MRFFSVARRLLLFYAFIKPRLRSLARQEEEQDDPLLEDLEYDPPSSGR